jgi:hypothetical protein
LNGSISLIFAPDWRIQEIRLQPDTDQDEARLRDLAECLLPILERPEEAREE